MSDPNMVTIPIGEYTSLLDAALRLQCLEDAGVDNWDGYDFAMEAYGDED